MKKPLRTSSSPAPLSRRAFTFGVANAALLGAVPRTVLARDSSGTGYFPPIPAFAANPFAQAALPIIRRAMERPGGRATPGAYKVLAADQFDLSMEMLRAYVASESPLSKNQDLLTAAISTANAAYENLALDPTPFNDFWTFAMRVQTALLFQNVTGRRYDRLFPNARPLIEKAIHTIETKPEAVASNDPRLRWVNRDIKMLGALVYADLLTGTSQHAELIASGIREMQAALQPDGATSYYDQQNEAFNYHYIFVIDAARLWQVTGNTAFHDLAAATEWYLPLSSPTPGVSEYATAPSWKHAWTVDGGEAIAAAVVTGLTGNRFNAFWIDGTKAPGSLFLASFYRPDVTPRDPEDDYLLYDRNIMGPRVKSGAFWSFGTTRATPNSTRGKSSFVGCLAYGDPIAGWKIHGALDTVGSEVYLQPSVNVDDPNSAKAYASLAQHEQNAATVTERLASLSTTHLLSALGAPAIPWRGRQLWLFFPSRLIGLVEVTPLRSQSAFGVAGVIKLVGANTDRNKTVGSLYPIERPDARTVAFGDLAVTVHDRSYARLETVRAKVNEHDTASGALRIILSDGIGEERPYRSGTSSYFLVEIRPKDTPAASDAKRLSSGFGFTLTTENRERYSAIANFESSPLELTAARRATGVAASSVAFRSGSQLYRPAWLPPATASESPIENGSSDAELHSGEHVVFVG